MSKYDALDAHTQLEQTIAEDLKAALEKRGMKVVHRGTEGSHAPSGLPDIVASNKQIVLTFEPTKSRGAAQDRELNSIRAHLDQVKADHGQKRCYCVFISPETSPRMLDGIRDHNQQRAKEGKPDRKILPLCFDALELWTTRLRESEADLYPVSAFIKLFDRHTEFIDDLRIRKLLLQNVFPTDAELFEVVEREEIERDRRTLETLIKDLARVENYMRENGIAVAHAAIDTLIYLKDGHIDYENALKVSEEFFDAHPAAQVRKGDILIASTGYVSMGKVDVYDRDEPAMISGELLAVRVKDEYDSYFICYFLRSHLGQIQFDKWFSGSSGQIHIYDMDIGQFIVPASGADGVPLEEQKRIATKITEQLNKARVLEWQAEMKWREAKERFEKMILAGP